MSTLRLPVRFMEQTRMDASQLKSLGMLGRQGGESIERKLAIHQCIREGLVSPSTAHLKPVPPLR